MASYISHVMESMGFTDGTNLPIANDENQELLAQINQLTKDRTEKDNSLSNIEQRTQNLDGHFKNAQTGIDQNLKLLNAYRNQVDSENHMYQIGERERSKMRQELKDLNKEIETVQGYENTTETEINKITRNIEKLSGKIEWAKTVLAEWNEAMEKSDETNKLIERYCKDDETKAHALETRSRYLRDNIAKKRQFLISMYDEQKSIEQTLDRTAQLYRQGHTERRALVATWKDAVKQMNQRETDIEKAEQDLEYAEMELDDKKLELKEQEDFLNELISNNKEVDLEILHLNEETSTVRKRFEKMNENSALLENQVGILRKHVQIVEQRIQQQRQRNKQIVKEKSEKEINLEKNDEDYHNLNERYKKLIDKHLSTQERLNILEEMVNNEEKAKKQLVHETTRIDGLLFRSQQQLTKLQDEEKLLLASNKGIESATTALHANIRDTEKQLQNQTETDYNVSLRAQLLEMRIAKMQGACLSLDDVLKQQNTLHSLEIEYAATSKLIINIQLQIDKLDKDMKKLTAIYELDAKEIEKMNYKIKDALLYVEGGSKEIRHTHQANQKKIVEMSILKMRVHEMETQITKCDDKVYSLEKHRIQLDRTMKERMVDIKSQVELLIMKRKHLAEVRGTLKCDLGERDIKIDAFKKRYQIASDMMGKNDDGTVVTATQLKIESAQEKQMLLQEGNELNQKVLKAEQEIKAMENTLCLLNYSNDAYRQTFEKLDNENPECLELESNNKAYCKLLLRLKSLKADVSTREHDIKELIERRDSVEQDLDEQIRVRTDNSEVLSKIHKELLDQKVKIQRADREIKCTTKAVRQRSFNRNFLAIFEKDIKLREIEEINANSFQLMADFVEINDDLAAQVTQMLDDKGLHIPKLKKPKSITTCRSDFSDMSISTSKASNSSCSTKSTGSSRRDLPCSCKTPSIISMEFLAEPICKALGPCEFPLPSHRKKFFKKKK